MNNFDTYEKIKSIDNVIKFWMESNNIDWKKEQIYSWGWTKRDEQLDIKTIYKDSNLEFELVKSDELTNLTQNMSDNVCVRYFDVSDKSLFKRKLENKFVMDVTLNLFSGILPYNLVITNVSPDASLFPKDTLYSEQGNWYTGF